MIMTRYRVTSPASKSALALLRQGKMLRWNGTWWVVIGEEQSGTRFKHETALTLWLYGQAIIWRDTRGERPELKCRTV